MARRNAAPSSGTARRVVGGTLMGSGLAGAAFFALLTAWYALNLFSQMFYFGLGDAAESWAASKVMASGLLALGTCALVAGIGRRILGARVAI